MSWEQRARKVDNRKKVMKKHGKSLLHTNDTSEDKKRKRAKKRGRFVESNEW